MGSGATKRLIESNLSILDRVTNLENHAKGMDNEHVRLLTAIQGSFETSDKMLRNLAEILSACVAVVGPELITAAVDNARKVAKEERIAQAKAALDGFVADGTMIVTDTVVEESLVVGHETLPDGTDSGRLQFLIHDLAEDRKMALMGKVPGFVIDFPSGSKFEINEIYNVVVKPEEVDPAETVEQDNV